MPFLTWLTLAMLTTTVLLGGGGLVLSAVVLGVLIAAIIWVTL